MKLKLHVPVEKIDQGWGAFSWRSELLEVDVIRIIRQPWRTAKGVYPQKVLAWTYSADTHDPRIHPDAFRSATDGAYREWISRRLNPDWVPPFFLADERVVHIL